MYDSRAGIFSIAVLLLIGLVLLYGVDVEAGRKDADEEDQRIKKNLSELDYSQE
jgi:MFS-type transporter involved in bile tolerance (Atg22 family)